MEKDLIPYEQALELAKLGFNEPCFGWWFADEEMLIIEKSKKSTSENIIQAPTFSQAFRWFREKYGLYGYIATYNATDFEWYIHDKPNDEDLEDTTTQDTYEEAELACLIKLIEIAKNGK